MEKKKHQPEVLKDLRSKDKAERRKELKKLVVYEAIMKPKFEEGLKLVPLFLAIGFLIASCTVAPVSDLQISYPHFSSLSSCDKVTLSDAFNMASCPATKGEVKETRIEPVVDEEGDTLMYLVNYDDGWIILSADKRTPAIIAQSEVGSISLLTENESLRDWLEMTAADMKAIIHLQDKDLTFSEAEINSHRQAWSKVSGAEPLRLPRDTLPILPYYDGEWELVRTETEEVYYDHVDHFVPAQWDQSYPYNYYCPPKDSGSGNKPVGCTPVACGEMLQYLCNRFAYHLTLSWNSYYADINDVALPYSDTLNNHSTPMLLRILGFELNAHYTDSCTYVYNSLTKIKNFYSSVGISSTKQSYSVDKVAQNLLDGMPVLVSARTSSDGHTFIIDGYKRTRTMYMEYYQRLIGYPPILEERTDTVGYSSPHLYRVKMNWGWASQWTHNYNNDWFALTGGWYVHSGDQYDQDINILCDYSFSMNS